MMIMVMVEAMVRAVVELVVVVAKVVVLVVLLTFCNKWGVIEMHRDMRSQPSILTIRDA
jgi:hypothetical protein